MKKNFMELLNQAKLWGMNLVHASSAAPMEQTLEVYLQSADKRFLVGRLSCEQGEFVFRYDPSYRDKPISAFPSTEREYRSRHLWPFFAIRIPPFDREDMRREFGSQSLREDQIMEILGSVAKVSVANPYEFKLVGG